jgi:hypothetical protein
MPAPKGHPNYNIHGHGRPRKFDDEFIENEASALYEWIATTDRLYFKDFAFERGYGANKLVVFAERSENFREALENAKHWQESRLMHGGLTKEFDSGFTKFTMAHVCGWSDTKNININSNGPVPGWISEAAGESPGLVNAKKSSS